MFHELSINSIKENKITIVGGNKLFVSILKVGEANNCLFSLLLNIYSMPL